MTKYRITGESTVRPTNIPAGFTVEEIREPIKKFFTVASDDCTNPYGLRVFDDIEGDLYFDVTYRNNEDDGTATWLDTKNVRALRDLLTSRLNEAAPRLRAWIDEYKRHVYEVEPGWVIWDNTRTEADHAHQAQNPGRLVYGHSVEYLLDEFDVTEIKEP